MADLLTAALAAHLDREDERPADTREAALRRRVHAIVEQRLADPALSPAARPVSAIAAPWGLVNPAHFSRLFRAAYGVPPLEYRKTMGRASRPG